MSIEDLPRGSEVFAPDWEQHAGIDECAHIWHSVPYRTELGIVDFVEQCTKCGVPRCVRQWCVERLHHNGVHIFEDGTFDPLGGVLP